MNLLNEKELIRSKLKEKRDKIGAALRKQKSQKITNFLYKIDGFKYSTNIFCYISYLSEVETRSLIEYALARNIDLFVPKIINDEEIVAIRLSNFSNLELDSLGILTPKSGEILRGPIDIAVTPGLGFTKKGERIGYGRGYYDRWFLKNEVNIKIGLAFEDQIITKLPLEKTDINMDIVVTEKKIISVKSK